jgi:hypothetical protein
MTDITLAVLILLPVALTLVLKSNASLALLALTAGYALQSFTSSDITTGLEMININGVTDVDVDLFLLIVPLLLTLFFTSRSWQGRSKMILNVLAATAAGAMLTIISLPFISSFIDMNLSTSAIWPILQHIKTPIIVFGITYSLVMIWLSKSPSHSKKHKH